MWSEASQSDRQSGRVGRELGLIPVSREIWSRLKSRFDSCRLYLVKIMCLGKYRFRLEYHKLLQMPCACRHYCASPIMNGLTRPPWSATQIPSTLYANRGRSQTVLDRNLL